MRKQAAAAPPDPATSTWIPMASKHDAALYKIWKICTDEHEGQKEKEVDELRETRDFLCYS